MSTLAQADAWPTIVVAGPTAIGKTAVALEIADALGGRAEIMSADSVQVYRHLDVGSAKPSTDERRRARFHLIDIADPDDEFSVADFQTAADAARGQIGSRGAAVVVAGGTGFYVRALIRPLGMSRAFADEAVRARWRLFAAENGPEGLLAQLRAVDPASAQRLHVNDQRRIVRALEVWETTGRTLSEWARLDATAGAAILPGARVFVLDRDRSALRRAIDDRVDAMMRAGFLDEVAGLRRRGYGPDLKPMQSLGYRELNAHLDGAMAVEDAIETIKRRTRQYARRQLIWYRSEPAAEWLDVEGRGPHAVARDILGRIAGSTTV